MKYVVCRKLCFDFLTVVRYENQSAAVKAGPSLEGDEVR